jgi:uncharacterized protein
MVSVVLDTNLLIAGRWNKKSSSLKIIDLCIKGSLNAVYTRQIKDENLFILSKVKAPRDYLEKIRLFYESGRLVEAGERIRASVDDSDNRFLEAAVAGKADYVLSNDHHLLDLGEYEGIRIVRPGKFTRMMA